MKVTTPEISWHEREPIYSVDFQPGDHCIRRLASGGVDKIVRIWQYKQDEEGKGTVEFLSNLRRHTATINVVRFSKNGELLASAGDDGTIILWKLSDVPTPSNNIFADDGEDEDRETWVCHKTLRGHLEDVADLSWSRDSRFLISGSVDNTAIVWDVLKEKKVAMFREHKSYVQGVAFDPLGDMAVTMSSDRSMRVFNLNSKNCVHNVSKMTAPHSLKDKEPNNTSETKPKHSRIFHDDSFRSFFRRLEFSPDGQLLITPAGCMETSEGKVINASFIFARGAMSKPAVYLPSVEKVTTAVRVNPQLYQLRPVDNAPSDNSAHTDSSNKDLEKEWVKNNSMFCLPYRVVFSVATEDSIIIYDTQQTMPIGLLKNIHYHQISDMSWSEDGKALIVASTDGFCTIANFEDGELGTVYRKEANMAGISSKTESSASGIPVTTMVVDTEEPPEIVSPNKDLPFTQQNFVGIKTSPVKLQKDTMKVSPHKPESNAKDTSVKTQVLEGKRTVSSDTILKTQVDEKKSTTPEINNGIDRNMSEGNLQKCDEGEKGEKEKNSPEAPKKKRIQLTTISLKGKN